MDDHGVRASRTSPFDWTSVLRGHVAFTDLRTAGGAGVAEDVRHLTSIGPLGVENRRETPLTPSLRAALPSPGQLRVRRRGGLSKDLTVVQPIVPVVRDADRHTVADLDRATARKR